MFKNPCLQQFLNGQMRGVQKIPPYSPFRGESRGGIFLNTPAHPLSPLNTVGEFLNTPCA